MLDGQHARRQRISRIAFQHGHASLHNDAAVIDLLVHKMRGRAGDLRAVGEDRLVHVMAVHAHAAEGRDQRRMDVDDAVFKRAHNLRAHDRQIARQHDKLRLRLFAACQNPFVITKYKGLDPEVFSGVDSNVYPRPVTWTLGLIASF